ncbi:MAG: endo-1,4-beta-xylanase [Prevotellaceae bacterium]|nr:endo-1,4-beta-xylanase [Candidatus Minthosoma caballi]
MNYKHILLAFFALHSSLFTLNAQTLADAYKDYWYTGVSVNQWEVAAETNPKKDLDYSGFVGADQTADWAVVEKNFNTVVAENCMKPEVVHPSEGVYDFTLADQFVEKSLAAGMRIHGHVLVWHSQCPYWFHHDADGKLVSKEVLKKRMKEHITTVMAHFKGRVASWDVVNEAFEDNGSFRNSLWYQILGEDFIPLAFQYAHEADPTAELYYNDYNMNKASKVESVCKFFKPLIDKGLPITAIGMQGHMILEDGHKTIEQYQHSIDCIKATGLKTFYSELDLSVLPNPYGFSGANVSDRLKYTPEKDPYKEKISPEKQAEADEYWIDFYKMLIRNKESILRVNFWCVNDANSWKNDFPIKGRTDYATLVDRNNQLKPVVQKLIELVQPSAGVQEKGSKKKRK